MYANLPYNAIQDGHLSWEDPGVQAHIKQLMDECDWYEDDEGYMYIVDFEGGDVHGPADDPERQIQIADLLWQYLGANPDDTYGAAAFASKACECEIGYIPVVLRRFGTEDGFYHA